MDSKCDLLWRQRARALHAKVKPLVLVGALATLPSIVCCMSEPEWQTLTATEKGSTVQEEAKQARTGEAAPPRAEAKDPVREKWGIEVMGVSLTAADSMLDFRYRVIDPDKARRFMDRRHKPYLVAQASGLVMGSPSPPKIGPLRQASRNPTANRTYFVMFVNPGRVIKAGDRVSITIKDHKVVENLVVR